MSKRIVVNVGRDSRPGSPSRKVTSSPSSISSGTATSSIVGSVYKGTVTNVLPGMQAAFVDIGLAKDAFLYAGDYTANLGRRSPSGGSGRGRRGGRPRRPSSTPRARSSPAVRPPAPSRRCCSRGQDVLVQVAKESLGTKGARITSFISLPGRYVVYMPQARHIGVSRRIRDERERDRLRGRAARARAAARRLHPANQRRGQGRGRVRCRRGVPGPAVGADPHPVRDGVGAGRPARGGRPHLPRRARPLLARGRRVRGGRPERP